MTASRGAGILPAMTHTAVAGDHERSRPGLPTRCPRCRSPLLADGGEPYCLACGWRDAAPRPPDRPAPPPRVTRRGAYARGERNGNAKLTDAAVATIRERAARGDTYAALAAAFGVSVRHVGNVVRRELRA